MPSARFFKEKDEDGKETGREMVEIFNPTDKNSVILPADQAQQEQYPQEWAKYNGRGGAGASEGHNASVQTTDIPERSVRADNPANDQVLEKKNHKERK